MNKKVKKNPASLVPGGRQAAGWRPVQVPGRPEASLQPAEEKVPAGPPEAGHLACPWPAQVLPHLRTRQAASLSRWPSFLPFSWLGWSFIYRWFSFPALYTLFTFTCRWPSFPTLHTLLEMHLTDDLPYLVDMLFFLHVYLLYLTAYKTHHIFIKVAWQAVLCLTYKCETSCRFNF